MTDLQRLSAISSLLGWICLALMAFLPASVIACWLYFDVFGPGIADRLGIARTYTIPDQLTSLQIALGIGVMMVPVAIMMFGLWNLRQLFAGFGAGRIFTIENTRALRIFAWSAMAVIVVQFFTDGLLTVVLTLNRPSSDATMFSGSRSRTLMTLINLSSCLVICSTGKREASTVIVMRDRSSRSVGLTARESML